MKTATVGIAPLKPFVPLISSFIPRRTKLPVLETVKLRAGGGSLHLTATDLDRELSLRIGDPENRFSGCVSWSALRTALDAGSDAADFDPVDSRISYSGGCALARFEEASEFPRFFWENRKGDPASLKIQADFIAALADSQPYASTDETRFVLNGYFVDVSRGYVVATDGRRLIRTDVNIPQMDPIDTESTVGFILPDHRWVKAKILRGVDGSLKLGRGHEHGGINSARFTFRIGPAVVQISTRLIEGRFPNYEQVLPDLNALAHSVPLPKDKALMSGLRSRKDKSVLIHPKNGRSVASFHDGDGLLAEFPLSDSPSEAETCLRADFLRDAISAGFGRLETIDDSSPAVCRDHRRLAIIMPMRKW